MKPIAAALATVLLALCACTRRDASAPAAPRSPVALAAPSPADLPGSGPAAPATPEPPPSAAEVAAFEAPVPK